MQREAIEAGDTGTEGGWSYNNKPKYVGNWGCLRVRVTVRWDQ